VLGKTLENKLWKKIVKPVGKLALGVWWAIEKQIFEMENKIAQTLKPSQGQKNGHKKK